MTLPSAGFLLDCRSVLLCVYLLEVVLEVVIKGVQQEFDFGFSFSLN